jgi:hypothetical protein
VRDRTGSVEWARADAERVRDRAVRSEPDSNLFVDVSVVLGGEWELPPPAAPAPVERPWWDPRRFLPEEEPEAPAGERPPGTMANPTGSGDGQ